MADLRPNLTLCFRTFGLPATVSLPGQAAVGTTGIWLSPAALTIDGVIVATHAPQRVLALPVSAVPSLARGTTVAIARQAGAAIETWTVEAIAGESDDEQWRVVIIPS